jgi:hypothetical protein
VEVVAAVVMAATLLTEELIVTGMGDMAVLAAKEPTIAPVWAAMVVGAVTAVMFMVTLAMAAMVATLVMVAMG